METNKLTYSSLSLDFADLYTYVTNLKEQVDTLNSQNKALSFRLNEQTQHPPAQITPVVVDYNQLATTYQENIAVIVKERDELKKQNEKMRAELFESINQSNLFKDNFGKQLNALQKKAQQLELLVRCVFKIPEAFVSELDFLKNNNKTIETVLKQEEVIQKITEMLKKIEELKDENSVLRGKVKTLINENNKFSEALESEKRTLDATKSEFVKKEEVFKMQIDELKGSAETEETTKDVLKRCEAINDCMNVLINSWKKAGESAFVEKMECEEENKNNEQNETSEVKTVQNTKKPEVVSHSMEVEKPKEEEEVLDERFLESSPKSVVRPADNVTNIVETNKKDENRENKMDEEPPKREMEVVSVEDSNSEPQKKSGSEEDVDLL
ncbi:hypothetical protein EIN_440420 [Entamoeba invadens IP1]|uniref:Uncharacterized protein n=1 Tax=Entamoeba invadens IP1 TaxID=370355 RepID=A0A0A1TZE8_ENTIV|nr:hypothetical protein EIN_440420 [Entamoeba invadens IP1]ELP83898.1 hypothetical protein EIN_440420 [Entamoeba invadens IP1]|eukprot:XP_004183244.1 hypothetical protein EIN_440420 [Entamoeba invadens IP1]